MIKYFLLLKVSRILRQHLSRNVISVKNIFQIKYLVPIKKLHFEDKFHPCNKNCGKVFTSKTDLLKHYCVGEKISHECDICKKAFRERINLSAHKRIHGSEKPYECNICKKTFINSSALTYHKRLHTGEKPYECGICKTAFSSGSILTNKKNAYR